ncbi:hypothetical protein A2634_01205 [Candidatus Amesbacteria bacterium RIFCSPHIGHO2_01_FULL_48_32]|uniref:Uncharacterized protein n=1 Tax=Candidatus Amesbacteria bacterium RIFCSPLOWO2_01_FULL_48_25 TaxID=1797259 RepID=A0A1F4ZBB8_9BACT|nr:MAG: hypothetical protein A2634_01205 [Candidatus Amesbacteria bacterium RIFCSPHIGHO2_01_FULL_48_32]OGD03659.1 MAG: hypothetical protein A2989_03190 [Candidatus Amesbacteria bacterium RIFCSPLOWO2_01_FULL_48_25]HJZ05992.1 hypothetical protein [Patescibacteria group bacterium]
MEFDPGKPYVESEDTVRLTWRDGWIRNGVWRVSIEDYLTFVRDVGLISWGWMMRLVQPEVGDWILPVPIIRNGRLHRILFDQREAEEKLVMYESSGPEQG